MVSLIVSVGPAQIILIKETAYAILKLYLGDLPSLATELALVTVCDQGQLSLAYPPNNHIKYCLSVFFFWNHIKEGEYVKEETKNISGI